VFSTVQKRGGGGGKGKVNIVRGGKGGDLKGKKKKKHEALLIGRGGAKFHVDDHLQGGG